MITVPTAPTVAIDELVISTKRNQLADSFNAVLRQGVGDPTFRIWWKAWSLFRAVRNPDGDAYPAHDEWFSHYINIPPGGDTWPEAGVGDGGGINAVNPMMTFIFGDASNGVFDEQGRLAPDPDGFPFGDSDTALAQWELGKSQRGAHDPITGAENSPAAEVARAHFALYRYQNTYLKKYGGMMGGPVGAGDCIPEIVEPRVNYPVTFSPLGGGAARTFGTCPGNPTDVAQLTFLPDRYRLLFFNGTHEDLYFARYIYGPYLTNSSLAHTAGFQIDEALHQFNATFKGTEAQRANDATFQIQNIAFDFQKYLTTQNFLAPAIGYVIGNAIFEDYPTFTIVGEADLVVGPPNSPRTTLTQWGSCPDGYALCGYRVITTTTVPQTLELFDTETHAVALTIKVAAGSTDSVVWLAKPLDFTNLLLRINGFVQDEAAYLYVQCAVMEKLKPTLQDAYVLLRLGTTNGVGGFDSDGHNTAGKAVSDSYFSKHCLAGKPLPPPASPGENPVYEAIRKKLHDNLRMAKRPSLRGYAVENGKSVLWFESTVAVGSKRFDLWDGIAPSAAIVASGSIKTGETYAVTVASISYNSTTVSSGSEFVGVAGVSTYTGDGEVRLANGIVTTAPSDGLTNEWAMRMSTIGFNNSEGSAFKPENYGDVLGFLHNRCHFENPDLLPRAFASDLGDFAAPGQLLQIIYAEAASQFNYYKNTNSPNATRQTRINFFSSCQIYAPDYEIESLKRDGGEVKITFKTRFQSLTTGDLARSPATWDDAALRAEAYRTDENAIRQYLLEPLCQGKLGDAALAQSIGNFGSYGACLPRFYFTKLVEKVVEDVPPNETQELTDTRVFSAQLDWMVWLLDAVCEGFNDLQFNGVAACPSRPASYTFENLIYQASDSKLRCISFLPGAERDDNPTGYGPFPNTKIYAETFNLIAKGLNLLTTATLELPWQVEHRLRSFWGRDDIAVTRTATGGAQEDAYRAACAGGAGGGEIGGSNNITGFKASPNFESVELPPTDWAAGFGSVTAGARANGTGISPYLIPVLSGHVDGIEYVAHTPPGGVLHFQVVGCSGGVASNQLLGLLGYTELRLKDVDDALEAVPAALRPNISGASSIVGYITRTDTWHETAPDGYSPRCGPGAVWPTTGAGVVRLVDKSRTEKKCITADLQNGVFSMRRYLFEDSITGWCVEDSQYALMIQAGSIGAVDFSCSFGAGSTVEFKPESAQILTVTIPRV